MNKTHLYVTGKIQEVQYKCPHCLKHIQYETDMLPAKSECHSCLKPIDFEIIIKP